MRQILTARAAEQMAWVPKANTSWIGKCYTSRFFEYLKSTLSLPNWPIELLKLPISATRNFVANGNALYMSDQTSQRTKTITPTRHSIKWAFVPTGLSLRAFRCLSPRNIMWWDTDVNYSTIQLPRTVFVFHNFNQIVSVSVELLLDECTCR